MIRSSQSELVGTNIIFVQHAQHHLAEGYFAGDKKCISVRTYPTREDRVGVSVISRGVPVNLIYDAWKMKKVF